MNINDLFLRLYKEKFGNHITKEIAEKIVEDMAVTDGSTRDTGEKWNIYEAVQMAEEVSADLSQIDKNEWYIVLNAMYSDYFPSVKKYNLPDVFYAELAHDWFYDIDAEDNKTFSYFMHF